jgi:large subunit ribosomal protein L19
MNTIIKDKITKKKEKLLSTNIMKLVESKHLRSLKIGEESICIGDVLRIGYLIPEGNKERTQYYEGLVIAMNNHGVGKTFTIRRSVQGIGIEQIFLFHSPKILSISKKQASKVRRSKLYYIRQLKGKASRLKRKL